MQQGHDLGRRGHDPLTPGRPLQGAGQREGVQEPVSAVGPGSAVRLHPVRPAVSVCLSADRESRTRREKRRGKAVGGRCTGTGLSTEQNSSHKCTPSTGLGTAQRDKLDGGGTTLVS